MARSLKSVPPQLNLEIPPEIVSLKEAAKLYRELTGRRKSVKVLAEEIHKRPQLGDWQEVRGGRPRLRRVRLAHWEYFLKARLAMYGRRGIFHDNEL